MNAREDRMHGEAPQRPTASLRAGLASLAWCLAGACASAPVPVQPPVERDASRALAQAMELWRDADVRALEPALEAAQAASELAPDWVAPLRFVDDRMREELLGPNALERHREILAGKPGDATHLYLAGRLEGEPGVGRLRDAAAHEPALSWAQHGLAWNAFLEGRMSEALRRGEGALARARDPFERANFSSMLARYRRASEDYPAAVQVLEACLADEGLSPRSRAWILSELAGTELGCDHPEVRRRGVRRALDLIATRPLSQIELDTLVNALRFPRRPVAVTFADVELALAERAARDGLCDPSPALPSSAFELGRWDRAGEGNGYGAHRLRAARFAHGDPRQAVEAWLAELPEQVLGPDGLPADERLARVVAAVRALGDVALDRAPREQVVELGEALIDAGWFREARCLAARSPGGDLDYAEDLAARALAGRATLDSIADLLRDLPQKRPRFPALAGDEPVDGPAPEPEALEVRDLDALLGALSGIFQRAHRFLGGQPSEELLREELLASPRIDYGWVGALLHPGATFSAQDEELGRGRAGDPVRGVSEEFHRLGRFAVIGDMAGARAPDGTILQLLLLEPRSGEHLGVEWSGTVAWCQGTDFNGGAARTGVAIGGAALHEGYFVDLDVVRDEYRRWQRLARRFGEPQGARRVSRALAVRGVPMQRGERWTDAQLLLGEADRMRLAVMADRAGPDGVLGEVEFAEFVELTAIHEEGHLCDRARFYPVSGRVWSILGFVLSAGLSPTRVAGQLEYRAQLVALCEAPDPRLAWAEILQAAEAGAGLTPHAAAYTRLLGDLLGEIEQAWGSDPLAWRELDPERLLVQQVHHLGPDKLRETALGLARRRGLVMERPRP